MVLRQALEKAYKGNVGHADLVIGTVTLVSLIYKLTINEHVGVLKFTFNFGGIIVQNIRNAKRTHKLNHHNSATIIIRPVSLKSPYHQQLHSS